MRGAADRSSLSHPGFHRQDVVSAIPAVRPSCRATFEASSNYGPFTTSEIAIEFGNQNPFMPASKPAWDGFEAFVIVAVASAVILAAVFALLFLRGGI